MENPYYRFIQNKDLFDYIENESIDFKKSINEIVSIKYSGQSSIDKWTTTNIFPNYLYLHLSRLHIHLYLKHLL